MKNFEKNFTKTTPDEESKENKERKSSSELISDGKKMIEDIKEMHEKLKKMPYEIYSTALSEKPEIKDRTIFAAGAYPKKELIHGSSQIYVGGGEYGHLGGWMKGEDVATKLKESCKEDEDFIKSEIISLPDDFAEAQKFLKNLNFNEGEIVRIYYDNPLGQYPRDGYSMLSLEDAEKNNIILEDSNSFTNPEGWKRVTTPVGRCYIENNQIVD